MKEEALKLADYVDAREINNPHLKEVSAMIRRLVEELDNKQQGLVEASGMLFNYKYELDLERAMSAQLKEELDKQNPSVFTVLTCGCKSKFMGFPSEWDGETRECEPCVNYGSLCEQHFMEYEARPAQYTPQTKPLSDEELEEVIRRHWNREYGNRNMLTLCRAIEERHGIK